MSSWPLMRRSGAGCITFSVVLTLLSACSLGPRYVQPNPPMPVTFVEAVTPDYDAAKPPSSLWHAFGDPLLDTLIETALAHNKTLQQAVAQVNQARALRGLEFYSVIPTVTASASRIRNKPSGRDPAIPPGVGTTNSFKAGFDAVWEIDLFGAALNARRVLRAEQSAAEASLQAVRLSVVAEVAQAYFGLRAEQQRLRLQQRNVMNLEDNQRLLGARFDAGRGTELDLSRARTLLLSTQARLPQVQTSITRNEQRLAVLTAQPIEALRSQLGAPTPLPALPPLVSVGTPEQWLRRRPDVHAAEQKLASATANIGIDAADYLPHLSLIGSFGWTGQVAGDTGKAVAERSQFGPSLSWSFLDIGRVRQRVRADKAKAAAALATYEDTVLRALEETENALAGYRSANQVATKLGEAAVSARTASDLAQQRFDAGATDILIMLDAERSQLDLEDQLATAESQRATSLAALYKALAGDFAAAE
jgi:outer membrane protein, multidrug efflux system